MKNLFLILFLFALASCQKDVVRSSQNENLVCVELSEPLFLSKQKPKKPIPTEQVYGTLYLDFDGHLVSGTSWNTSGDFYCEGAGLEQWKIDSIFRMVQREYAPFKITPTTSESVYNLATKRMRVVITKTWEWYGRAGGVAYTNSYSWNDGTPCFAFSSLLQDVPVDIGHVVIHESGHTFGLRHQALYENGVKVSDYRPGVWMGSYGSGGGWIVGLNPYGQVQDDKAILAATLGYR